MPDEPRDADDHLPDRAEGTTTRLVHGDRVVRPRGAVVAPIDQASTFVSASADHFREASTTPQSAELYTRYGNTNHAQAAQLIAALEGAGAGLMTASGMGAISTCVLSLLKAGDHVVTQRSAYGGVIELGDELLPRFGVEVTAVDQTDLAAWEAAIRPGTRLVLVETPSNPHLQLTDIAAVSELAHRHGALVLADNTFATPVNQRPLELGADLVWHSATKYLGGHSDLLAGAIVGSKELVEEVWKTSIVTGATLGPFDAWLLTRGLRTLALRMERHNTNGQALAELCAAHPAISAVHYPGLPDHPGHELAKRQMSGFGGVFSVQLAGGGAAADRFIEELQLISHAVSLGGVESLVMHSAAMWGDDGPDEDEPEPDPYAIRPGFVRIAAGIEDTGDLVADVTRALDRAAG